MIVPAAFHKRMASMLGSKDYQAFLATNQQSPYNGLRVNTEKTSAASLQSIFALKQAPFCEEQYYCEKISGNHPYHAAGLFYLQEPSAGSAVAVLNPQPYENVLDLCAAPGGKTTQIAARMKNCGVLVANEFVASRAQILLSNIERMGVRHAVVTNQHPTALCAQLIGYFDKILVDAPCSGEGMFRKDVQAVQAWSEEHVRTCGKRQLQILEDAITALKVGGELVYSTCTYAMEENEDVIQAVLENHSDIELVAIPAAFGCDGYTKPLVPGHAVRRIYPMHGGEGHFVAKLRRTWSSRKPTTVRNVATKENKHAAVFLREQLQGYDATALLTYRDQVYLLPNDMPLLQGNVLRCGVCIGSYQNNHFLPHHHLYKVLKQENYRQSVYLELDDLRTAAYLSGHEIEAVYPQNGYVAVLVDGYPLGFGKQSNMRIKNHYPKGLRIK